LYSWPFLYRYMKNLNILLRIFLLQLIPALALSQHIDKPNFAISSHPITMVSLDRDSSMLKLNLELENHLANGYFCASKNIVLKDLILKGKTDLIKAVGVPVCPEQYHFKWPGEKLSFSLIFQAVDTSVHYVDLYELCDANCLTINGIILDSTMNSLINHAFDAYTHENKEVALQFFKTAIERYPDYPYGFLYGNVIKILLEKKEKKEAIKWANKLNDSNILDKYSILKQIEKQKGFSIE